MTKAKAKPATKPAHKSKTVIANVILIALALADVADVVQMDFITEEWWAMLIGGLNVGLRFTTDQAVRLKPKGKS